MSHPGTLTALIRPRFLDSNNNNSNHNYICNCNSSTDVNIHNFNNISEPQNTEAKGTKTDERQVKSLASTVTSASVNPVTMAGMQRVQVPNMFKAYNGIRYASDLGRAVRRLRCMLRHVSGAFPRLHAAGCGFKTVSRLALDGPCLKRLGGRVDIISGMRHAKSLGFGTFGDISAARHPNRILSWCLSISRQLHSRQKTTKQKRLASITPSWEELNNV